MGGPTTGPEDTERTRTLWFALLLTLANGFLDAHTYIARGGVFANVQTANVIFFAIDSSERKWAAALAHVWPLLAFIAGVALASHIKSGRVERIVPRPLRWTMAIQAVTLGIIGFVPASVPHTGADQFHGGNADRAVSQRGRPRLPARRNHWEPHAIRGSGVRRLCREARGVTPGVWGLRGTDTHLRLGRCGRRRHQPAWGAHAIWLPAAFLAVTLWLFIIDERTLR